MLGSVVNTLEQRGEWLNGGRGAATAMIDRRSANGVTPFEAAEHLEFFGAGDDLGVCANGFLQGEERREVAPPARMARGLRGHASVWKQTGEVELGAEKSLSAHAE